MVITTSQPAFAQSALQTQGGLVTANHHLAAKAGAAVLERGGNAVDAAAAVSFAAGVVEPAMSGLGGRGYLLIHFPERGETAVIDGHERAPMGATPDMFPVERPEQIPTQGWGPQVSVRGNVNQVGHRAVAVPGVLGALALAHRRFGRLPLKTIIEPAVELASQGFEIGVPLAILIGQNRAKLAQFPATAAIFLRGGHPPNPTDRLVQPDLAESLRRIGAQGPDEFYTGSIGQAIAAEMEQPGHGGPLSREDLARFEPRVWDRPLSGAYRGYRILGLPDATGAVTLIQIMNILEGFALGAQDRLGSASLHLLLEAFRTAFQDRLAVVDDGDFAEVPYAGLVSKVFAKARRASISHEQARAAIEPSDPWPYQHAAQTGAPRAQTARRRPADSDTTHFCVVDAERMVVSMTQSIIDPFGSGVVVPGTGILLNSAMHNFNPVPGQIGSIAPWKRSAHSGTPTIVLDPDGRPYLATGGAGGTKIVTGVAQVLVNLIDHGMSPQDAVAAPRVHNEGWDSQIDARIDAAAIGRLRQMGHRLEVIDTSYALPGFSRINAIKVEPDGSLTSGVDVFVDAGAAAVG